jgi:hypothetical protein
VRLGAGYALALSPDGRQALALEAVSPAKVVLVPTGPGKPVAFEGGPIASVGAATWFPDGRRVLIEGNEAGRVVRCYVASTDGGVPGPVTPEGVVGEVVSPDGRFVVGLDANRLAYFRYPVDGGDPVAVPGLERGERPFQWSADGRSLFVFRPGELPARVFRVDLETGRRDLWREVMPPDAAGVDGIAVFRMTPDARGYAYSYIRVLSSLYLVEGLTVAGK